MAKLKDTTVTGNLSVSGNITGTLPFHGNHVPTLETANNTRFLRNDATWQAVTAANIGAAPTGYGLGTTCITPSGNDWNNALKNGWYMLQGGSNCPESGQWAMGEVIAHNDNWVVQRVKTFAASTPKDYERTRNNGTWGAWAESRTIYNPGTALTLNGNTFNVDLGAGSTQAAPGNHSHGSVTASSNGFMTKEDKNKLDGIAVGANSYSHPSTHPMEMITRLPFAYIDTTSASGATASDGASQTGQVFSSAITATPVNLLSKSLSLFNLNYNIGVRCKCSSNSGTANILEVVLNGTVIGTLNAAQFTSANTWVFRNFNAAITQNANTLIIRTTNANTGATVSIENVFITPITLASLT